VIEINPMDESYIHVSCMHSGPVDPRKQPRSREDVPDLPRHPWSDEQIADLARNYKAISEGWRGEPAREFMREMIQRYGTCAILAWQDGLVVGQLRFYPLSIAHLLARADAKKQPASARSLKRWEPDAKALRVQCVMTCQPYVAASSCPALATVTPEPKDLPGCVTTLDGKKRFRTAEDAGARKGMGLKLVQGLISWARAHGWKRIVNVAHCDLDWHYGICGGGGKAFWEKAGFQVVGTFYDRAWEFDDNDRAIVQAQMAEKGMTEDDIWTWYRMAYEL